MQNANEEETVEVEEVLEDNTPEDDNGTDGEDSTEESEGEDSEPIEPDEEPVDISKPKEERRNHQIDRLKKEKADLKKENERLKQGGEKGQEGGSSLATNTELMERTFLAANGYKDKDVQNEVLRLAHKFDVPVNEALEDKDITSRAESILKRKTAQNSIARGTGGAAKKGKDAGYVASYFKKHGDFPEGTSNSLISKATDILAKD